MLSTFVVGDKLVGIRNSVHFSDNKRTRNKMKKKGKEASDRSA